MSSDFITEVAKGNVPGHSIVTIFGHNPDIDPGVRETIWDYGGEYTYLTANTELFVSSSSTSDTAVGLLIEGLTADYKPKQLLHTFTAGQSQESIGEWFRVFKFTVVSGTAPVGDLYIAKTDTLTLGVPDTAANVHEAMFFDANTSHKAMYTVPANHSAYLSRLFFATGNAEDSTVIMNTRLPEQPGFIQHNEFPIFQNTVFLDTAQLFGFKPKMDIEFRGTTLTNNSRLAVNFSMLLVNNKML